MKNVQKIIDRRGGLDNLSHLRVEVAGFMPLVIERIGEGPNGYPLVAVSHTYEQNGDLMRDPEMTFEVAGGEWYPVSYRLDNMGVNQVAVVKNGQGQVLVDLRLRKQLTAFARTWNTNIGQQGFVKA